MQMAELKDRRPTDSDVCKEGIVNIMDKGYEIWSCQAIGEEADHRDGCSEIGYVEGCSDGGGQ